ncbi:hypothetical protein CROQUDRAFT_45349 [Cronartium quercuum f. sp. fusiforme G11]|uniref:Uncharacterized protein n=1 Tax=Cronartium quercuum f. sp. fusiforme G11 TaxID=708437 RepID=A0A9P6TBJ8_9BASI|nr:hypothetical protein CROQUDRAFT_45349 [Cronartium quercuum f. sp. fusiforme G11]
MRTAPRAVDVSQAQTRSIKKERIPVPDHLRLSNLPSEILDRIIYYVQGFSIHEFHRIFHRKRAHIKIEEGEDYTEEPIFYGTYIRNHAPILNSLQNLAVANKRIYDLCRPRLWKKLIFPTSLPAFIYKWTLSSGLLFKHGDLVQSVSITLSSEWLSNDPAEVDKPFPYDNLSIYPAMDSQSWEAAPQGLSLKSTTKIFVMCPNIRSLRVNIPSPGERYGQRDMNRLQGRLKKLVSRLSNLKHLTLIHYGARPITDKFVVELLDNLPLLESFDCPAISRSGPGQLTKPLDWHLAQLQHLSSLKLNSCDCVDETWWLQSWPTNLTKLELNQCSNLPLIDAHRFVSHFSSQLTHLELDFPIIWLDDNIITPPIEHGIGPRWAAKNRFNLPLLTSLSIINPTKYGLLTTFQDCKNLRQLEYQSIPVSEWSIAQQLFCSSTWPQIKSFSLPAPQPHDSGDWEICSAQLKMKKFAFQNNINYEPDWY